MARKRFLQIACVAALLASRALASDDAVFVLDRETQNGTVLDPANGQILWNVPTSLWTRFAAADPTGTKVYFDTRIRQPFDEIGFGSFDVSTGTYTVRNDHVPYQWTAVTCFVAGGIWSGSTC